MRTQKEHKKHASYEASQLYGDAKTRTHIKLCGMFRDQDIDSLIDAQPDMCGFVVDVPRSHRSVTPERLIELCSRLDMLEQQGKSESIPTKHIKRVGVFVNMPPKKVIQITLDAHLDTLQLHGSEDETYLANLRTQLASLAPYTPCIIQAFRIRKSNDIERAGKSSADLVLLDSGQGTGQAFDWSLIHKLNRPFMLAGGLDPTTVTQAIRDVGPWGVDMSSGIETNGLKDPKKMKAAVAAVRKADRLSVTHDNPALTKDGRISDE